MKDLGIIRRMYYREDTEPKYQRRPSDRSKIAPFSECLTQALATDARRPKRDRRTALKLFAEIKASGFTGDYSRVTEFIRRWRAEGGEARIKAYVPLRFELGEAFQFDWSEERLVIGGIWRQDIGIAPQAVRQPRLCRTGLSHAEPRNAV